MPLRRTTAAAVVGLLFAASCSGDSSGPGEGASEPDASTTTLAPEDAAVLYAEAGPYPVGVTTIDVGGTQAEIWYPAAEGTSGTVSYDVRDFVPDAVRALLTSDEGATFEYPGKRDTPPAEDGPYPVVLFSHGFSGYRLQSSYLTSQLASYGMVVAAPDHPSRDLRAVLGGTAGGEPSASVDDLLATLDALVAAGERGGPVEGLVDEERVASLGHSAGGGTALAAARDPRVDGYVSMAAGAPEDGELPDKPSFFLAGSVDGVVSAAERTRPAFEAAPAPSTYWEIEATGHNAFSDLCAIGGTGIIGVAERSGLGPLLDAQPQLRSLGEDGCIPPAAPVAEVFPIIRHGVTAWLRWLFELDPEPVGLDPPLGAHGLEVIADSR